jgi:GAF domain-containing protein
VPDDSHPSDEDLRSLEGVLLGEQTLDVVLTMVATQARSTIARAEGVGVTLVRHERAETAAASDDVVQSVDSAQYENRDGPCLQAIRDGVRYNVDWDELSRRWPDVASSAAEHEIFSVLSMPLAVRDETVGALNIYSKEHQRFDDSTEEAASTFARRAAIVLANARAYATQQQVSEQLMEALRSRELIGQAKGILMERQGVSDEEAFDILRRASQRTNVKLRQVAEEIVETVRRGRRG